MVEELVFQKIKYLLSYPEDFEKDRRYPLVIYLHGAGMRGESTEPLRNNVSFCNLEKHQSRGYILLAPLCSVKDWNETMSSLIELVDFMRQQDYIDPKRVHLTGNSMGGYGTWELASLRPEWFASIMPLCGGGLSWMTAQLVDMPVRAFHGICDTVIDPAESLQMIKTLNRKGGNGELILFPKLGHNCWETVYTTEANYDWLLAFTTDREQTLVEQFSGAYYG